MSNTETNRQAAGSGDPPIVVANTTPRARPWVRELPYGAVLILTLFGVAYASYSREPSAGYWDLLAPAIGLVCVAAGWQKAEDGSARLKLIWTQALHWIAFLVVMNAMLLPGVQKMLNVGANGLAILTLLALGTFTAGVHILSWQVCCLGLVMALGIPAIAWVEESALFFVIIAGATLAIAAVLWWHRHESRIHDVGHPAGRSGG
ncbi:MAG: hypothetical protein P4M07_07870 [Xanthobacteraceae bacterium]|nr:hypothetical protein [Xanthobacteraceae bacterium]